MRCNTVRAVAELNLRRMGELDAAEREEIEGHLRGCAECEAALQSTEELNRSLAGAFLDVKVPEGLRTRVEKRLARQRHEQWLRRAGEVVRGLTAAAAVLLVGWGFSAWWQSRLTAIDGDGTWEQVHSRLVSPPTVETLGEHYRRFGFEGRFPANLNYAALISYGLGEFEGRPVPQLVFARLPPGEVGGGANARAAVAEVRVLSGRKFDVDGMPGEYQSPSGYVYKLEIWRDRASDCAELVMYTGENASWLLQSGEGTNN